jgi:hypothetical protein
VVVGSRALATRSEKGKDGVMGVGGEGESTGSEEGGVGMCDGLMG